MTITESSPPPSPKQLIPIESQDTLISHSVSHSSSPRRHPTLPPSAINKSLYYHFPTPPQSPQSVQLATSPRADSPRSTSGAPRRQRHARSTSRTTPANHTRRRSSLSASFYITQLIEAEYGPPPHPAPTTPLPPIPGAPRIAFTTPAQERSRYSSYELFDKLLSLEKQQKQKEVECKRHSAPPLRAQFSLPGPPVVRVDIRRTLSDPLDGQREARHTAMTREGKVY